VKRLASIILLVFLIFPFAGTYCWLHFKKQKIHKEIKWKLIARTDLNELVLIKIIAKTDNEQLNWKHSMEFEYKSEMYDIVSKEMHGDTTYYWCWWDHEETKLNRQLDDLVILAFGNNPDKSHRSQQLIDFMKLLYFQNYSCWDFNLPAEKKCFCIIDESNYSAPNFIPDAPPPKAS